MYSSVLDQGFVRLVRVGGTDQDIVKAARQSYTTMDEDRTQEQDQKLIDYLMRHRHTSPLEMVDMTFQIKCPIFVARQWLRHRTASLNEMSARYTELPEEYYIPDLDRVQAQSQNNKQGSEGELPLAVREAFQAETDAQGYTAFQGYREALDEGVSRELARINLPLSTYTVFTWKMDLHNLFHFLKLRMDGHAQYEIRVYAEAIMGMVREHFPMATRAFEEFGLYSMTLSRSVVEAITDVLRYHRDLLEVALLTRGVGDRERKEVLDAFCL